MDPGEPTVLFRGLPQQLRFPTEEKRALRDFAHNLCERVAAGRGFTCLVTNDGELRNLNQRFRGLDYVSDVLSFPSEQDRELGDIAISAEQARAQAQQFGHSYSDEVRVLMLHGLLHLTGMDHERDRGQMAHAEAKWRAEFGLPSGVIGRAASAGGHE